MSKAVALSLFDKVSQCSWYHFLLCFLPLQQPDNFLWWEVCGVISSDWNFQIGNRLSQGGAERNTARFSVSVYCWFFFSVLVCLVYEGVCVPSVIFKHTHTHTHDTHSPQERNSHHMLFDRVRLNEDISESFQLIVTSKRGSFLEISWDKEGGNFWGGKRGVFPSIGQRIFPKWLANYFHT